MDRIAPTRRPDAAPAMRQSWRELLFLHWEVPAGTVQRSLPSGLSVDTFEGRAFVGLVPFAMRDVRPVWSPSVPGLSHFLECNVRTYVHAGGENPGVWFYSLDAANPVAVLIARSRWRLPYFWARMRLRRDGAGRDYVTVRRRDAAFCRVRYRPEGGPAAAVPGTLEHFLAERYLLYAGDTRRLWRGQVHHRPYPLQPARVEALRQDLVAAAGFDTGGAPLAHYAAGVEVEVFGLRPV